MEGNPINWIQQLAQGDKFARPLPMEGEENRKDQRPKLAPGQLAPKPKQNLQLPDVEADPQLPVAYSGGIQPPGPTVSETGSSMVDDQWQLGSGPSWMAGLTSPQSGISDKTRQYVSLRQKLAQDRMADLNKRRMADDAVLPLVIQDHKDAASREEAIMTRIDMALRGLNNPPPAMQVPQLNQGELITAAATGLLAPDQLNTVVQALQAAAGQRTQVEFDNALRAYGLNRETAQMALNQLNDQLGFARQDKRDAVGREHEIAMARQRAEDDADKRYADRIFDIELLERQHGMKLEQERAEAETERLKAVAKAKEDADKEKVRLLEQKADNLRTEVSAYMNAYGGKLPPQVYQDLQRKRQDLVKAGYRDAPTIGPNNVPTRAELDREADEAYRTSEAEYRHGRDAKDDARRAYEDSLKESPGLKAIRSDIGQATDAIVKNRTNLEQSRAELAEMQAAKGGDSDAVSKYLNIDLNKAIREKQIEIKGLEARDRSLHTEKDRILKGAKALRERDEALRAGHAAAGGYAPIPGPDPMQQAAPRDWNPSKGPGGSQPLPDINSARKLFKAEIRKYPEAESRYRDRFKALYGREL